MPDNTHRFTGRAEDYDRYRQRYPTHEVLSRLREWCGLTPDWLVADIGAGTGMLAEVFLENGNRVIAIEPNRDMRGQMRTSMEQHLGRTFPQLEVIDATAEASTRPAASVDLVAVGRAFHWFDQDRALAEFRRILKPEGWVALVAADRDRDTTDPAYGEQIRAYEELMEIYGTNYSSVVRSGYRSYDTLENFLDGQLHRTQISGVRLMTWQEFLGHAKSLSITPRADTPSYKPFEAALERYFATHAVNGVFTSPTVCWLNAGRFK